MSVSRHWLLPLAGLLTGLLTAAPLAASEPGPDRDCLLRLAEEGEGSMTLAEVRERCRPGVAADEAPAAAVGERADEGAAKDDSAQPGDPGQPSMLQARMDSDRRAAGRPFSVTAHRPNYLLLGAWNAEGWDASPYAGEIGGEDYSNDDIESQFQVSLKMPVAVGLLDDRLDIYAAYTNRSFWQVYNREHSAPFRETNHEPEVWLQLRNDWTVFGLTNAVNTIGWVHQSNGQGGERSRSWDRLAANFAFERAHFAVVLRPWLWLDWEGEDSDNPDIDEYMGHGEVRLVYGRKGHVLSAMIRNQLESGFDRGAIELSWSFPVFGYSYLRGYVQYFQGYGESLIDYDRKVNRIGIGVSVTDWLD